MVQHLSFFLLAGPTNQRLPRTAQFSSLLCPVHQKSRRPDERLVPKMLTPSLETSSASIAHAKYFRTTTALQLSFNSYERANISRIVEDGRRKGCR